MPNVQNKESLEAIKQDLQNASAVWVLDYRGLTVKELEAFRSDIREAGATCKVYKNTLMRIAMRELNMPEMDEILSGPSAFVFSDSDPVASAKAIKDFAKNNKLLEIKGGTMEGDVLDAAGIEAVAALPSREQLLGQIAGLIAGFARDIAVVVDAIPSGLARAIDAVAKQKEAA